MQHPQVLVYEGDGLLAEQLRPFCVERLWALREPRRLESFARFLARGGPGVVVIKVGRDLVRELTLLERLHSLFAETAVVVVGDYDNAALAGLAWHLGASYVLFPPHPHQQLPVLAIHFLETASRPLASKTKPEP